MPTIALAGGGTAGHVLPSLALISELKKNFDNIIYLGGDGMEQDLVFRFTKHRILNSVERTRYKT